ELANDVLSQLWTLDVNENLIIVVYMCPLINAMISQVAAQGLITGLGQLALKRPVINEEENLPVVGLRRAAMDRKRFLLADDNMPHRRPSSSVVKSWAFGT